jgi:hypothetical protein
MIRSQYRDRIPPSVPSGGSGHVGDPGLDSSQGIHFGGTAVPERELGVGTHPQIEKPISELLSRSKSSLSACCVRQLRQALFPLT